MDVLSDRDTHHSVVSKLHTRAVISQEVMVAQMSGSDRGNSLLTVLGLEDKPHKLRELITAMMEEGKVRSLAEEMAALLSKIEQGIAINRSANIVVITMIAKYHNHIILCRNYFVVSFLQGLCKDRLYPYEIRMHEIIYMHIVHVEIKDYILAIADGLVGKVNKV